MEINDRLLVKVKDDKRALAIIDVLIVLALEMCDDDTFYILLRERFIDLCI